MAEESTFAALILRARAGDPAAATELVRCYEATIRRTVRILLLDARLRRLFDSMDICQSVLASFFVRLSLGQYQLDQPEQLVRLLVSMARNKLADQARRQQAQRRDQRLLEAEDVHEKEILAPDASPSRLAAGRELLREFRNRLTPEERHVADQRALGREWPEIAAELGVRPDALRKRFTRAINRVARAMGMDVYEDE